MKIKRFKNIITFLILIFGLVYFVVPESTSAAINPVYKVLAGGDDLGKNVRDVWNALISYINGLLIVLLVIVAFSQILRININTYGVKKILPTLILAIVAANFSFLICRLLVDIANVTMSIFLEADPMGTARSMDGGSTGKMLDAFSTIRGKTTITKEDLDSGANIFWFIIAQLMVIAGAVMVLILAYLFLIRNWVIYFLVALSPLGFIAMVLPQTKSIFNQWWGNMIKWTFMPVVSLFWIWLGGLWFSTAAAGSMFMNFAFAAVCFYLAITTPFKMGGAIMSTWGNLGKRVWGQTGGRATAWAGREARERTVDAGYRSLNWLQRGNRLGRAIDTRVGGRVRDFRQRNISARQERLLRAEGPGMVREKLQKDARVDAADRLARDPRTGDLERSRYRALQRAWVLDNAKITKFTNADLADLEAMVPHDAATGEIYNPENDPTGHYAAHSRYTEDGGYGDVMSAITEIARRARNARDPAERAAAQAIAHRLQVLRPSGRRVPLYQMDAHGYVGGIGTVTDENPSSIDEAQGQVDQARSSITNIASRIPQGASNASQIIHSAQYGTGSIESSDAMRVIIAGYDPEAKNTLLEHANAIRQTRDGIINSEMNSRKLEIDNTADGIDLIAKAGSKGIGLGRVKSEFQKAQDMLAQGNVSGARSVVGGLTASIPEFQNSDDTLKAIEKRMELIKRGLDHFEELNKRMGSIGDPGERQAEIQKIQQSLRTDPTAYINQFKEEMMAAAKSDAVASSFSQMAISNIASRNPSASVHDAMTSNEGIEELTEAVKGLHEHLRETGAAPGTGGIAQMTRLDPIGVGSQQIIKDAINNSIQQGVVSATTKMTEVLTNKTFQTSLAEGMKRALRETPVTTKTTGTQAAPTTPPTPTIRPNLKS